MFHELRSTSSFQVWGKTQSEAQWRVITVCVTPCRDHGSRWPFFRGACTCWAVDLVAVGTEYARELLSDPLLPAITCASPVQVAAGTLRDAERRVAAGASPFPSAAELMAHEIGHTAQARRYRLLYLPLVGAVTRFGEGSRWWNRFENEASAIGQFGGLCDPPTPQGESSSPGDAALLP